ncbi:MAG TPA: SIS domain-containing protein [Chloroflexota bacterium]|jgi:glucosamine--fructose-6-phosphate aminotransferase (isomerizing)|nr:SIS domain-containing protein [Chloroflexota bacterium]
MHTLYREIHQQPAILAAALERERAAVQRLAEALAARQLPLAMIVARGTSDHAAVYGKYLLESLASLPVALAAPSLYTLYKRPPRLDQAFVIAISQSGQSPDLVAVLTEAKRQGALTAALVNERDSPLAATAEHVLWCGSGVERAVAATKSYTAQLFLLAMLVAAITGDERLHAGLAGVPAAVSVALALDRRIHDIAVEQKEMDRCVVLARGYAYATALEVALKIKETSYVVADAYSGADFLHGPIAVIDPGFPALLFAADGPALPGILDLARLLQARRAFTIAVTDDARLAGAVERPLLLPTKQQEELAPIVQIVVGQLFAYHLSVAKGYDPDQPRGLRKVTITH